MTQTEINTWRTKAVLGIVDDCLNPLFLFSQTNREILLDIINEKIDPVEMACIEMRNRGLDIKTGKWVGWKSDKSQKVPA